MIMSLVSANLCVVDSSSGTAASQRGDLSLDIVRDVAGFHALQPFWDVLVDQMSTRSPFLRWDWVSLWWEECRQDAQLVIAVLRDAGGVPQAIAPLMLAREPDKARKHLLTLTFLGGFGHAHGERLDLMVPAGREEELTPQLCRVFKLMRSECDNVRLNHLPEESPNTRHLLVVLAEAYQGAGVLNRHACRFIHLPSSWADFEARHSSNWRNLLRRRCKAFTGQHAGVDTLAGERISTGEAMAKFRVLHGMQWPEGVSSFTTNDSWNFHQRLVERWIPQQRTLMPILEADGQVIAVLYGFIERGEFFHYQTGWAQSFAKISPGKLVMRCSVDASIQRGLQVYDMLSSDYSYKRQWCDGVRWLLDLEAFNPASWRATAFQTLRALRRWFPSRSEANPSTDTQEEHDQALRPVV